MEPVKSALESKGVWGSLITLAVPLLGLLGITLTADDTAVLVDSAVGMVTTISTFATLVGGVMALVGRLRATKRIGGIVHADPAKAALP
jgi:hypothetical protein